MMKKYTLAKIIELLLRIIVCTGLLGNLAIVLVFQTRNIALIFLNPIHRMSNYIAFSF